MALSEVIKVRLSKDERYRLAMEAKTKGLTLAAFIRLKLIGPQERESVVQSVATNLPDLVTAENVRTKIAALPEKPAVKRELSYRRFAEPGSLLKKQ